MIRKSCSIAQVFLLSLAFSSGVSLAKSQLSEKQAQALAIDAYIYGYPLVTMDMTRKVMTNVATVEGAHGPMGQFVNMQKYPDASFKDVTAPNADTLYSTAWLDLSKEPYILQVPNEDHRYYLMPLLSGWTDVFAAPGKRTTGTQAHNYAIIGPNWKGKIPQGITQLKSPTNMVWVLGRTYCTGTPEDYKAVHALQAEYKLVPLSAYGKPYTPPEGKVDPDVDMKTPVRDQVNALSANAYFNKLAELMKDNPPAKEDAPMIEKLAMLGIKPGEAFDANQDPVIAKAIEQAVRKAQTKIMMHEKQSSMVRNGWLYFLKTGWYGTDYLQRAFVTAIGLGANLPQDAIYPAATTDSKGKRLNGKNRYVIHFEKNKLPPVKGFWSLTMYNDQYFFVENALNRYTLSGRDKLKTNKDGSIDLYIQHDAPSKEKESNWLPAPEDDFNLMFRFYWPRESIVNGKWLPPAVERVEA
ncbi:MAG: hypothetical protein BGO43_15550 [Gammaproteobacteria bacterium 39-13]|nr:DUF1254 domain-containing protein [Gammaproteobacteria bacterium]OJV87824.1 MAG: hypothetical protein BGO43_15550 [Gammaproteobacteria bacterium 39-13]